MVSDEEDEQEESPDSWEGAKEELQQVMDMTLEDFKVSMGLLLTVLALSTDTDSACTVN